MTSWLLNPANESVVAAIGLAIGFVSLFATIVGFGVTVWQLVRTASATKAAAKAVDAIRSRVATYDLVFELSRSNAAIRETQRHFRNSAWADVIESMGTAREALTRLAELPSDLKNSDRDSLRRVAGELGETSAKLEVGNRKGNVRVDESKALKQFGIYLEMITRIGVSVERSL